MIGIIAGANKRYDIDALALFSRAQTLGYTQPSATNKKLISDFFKSAKSAAGGSLSPFLDIRIYANDINRASLTNEMLFEGLHWNNPTAELCAITNNINRQNKKGYRGNGVQNAYIDTKTIIDIAGNDNHRNDLSVMWFWHDVENIGLHSSGIYIGTQSRAIACYPKRDTTTGIMQHAGRGGSLTVSNGFNVYTAEIISGNINFYLNNVLAATNTVSWGTDFTTYMLDLGSNSNATTGTPTNTQSLPSTSCTLAACIVYRSSIVNRTDLYNAGVAYLNAVAAL